LVFVSLLLFWPAGTLIYWNGWLFIGLLFVPMLFLGIVLLFKSPELLEKRLNNEEKVLQEGLEGYRDYKQRVKYRMIPFIW